MSVSDNRWVFGYGSLIWRPGFKYLSAVPGLLFGSHRALCVYSHHYRGTEENPGLVFGLVPGGSCYGMAFEVKNNVWDEVIKYLRKREQITNVYHEVSRRVRLQNGQKIVATTFVVNRNHEQYTGRLTSDQENSLVKKAVGINGSNRDYVLNTAHHLQMLRIEDRHLNNLAKKLTID